MPKLNQMPTRAEFGMVFSGLPGMIRIGELIDEWHISGWFTQITIAFLIERASKFIIKNTGIPNPSHMLKVGGQLTGKQYEYLQSLHEFVYDSLKTSLLTNDLEYERSIIEEFGKDVFHLQQAEDIHDLSNNRMTYLRTTGEQRPFKLSFRAGLAYKWKFKEGRKTKLKLYDTISFNERYENGGAIFTMDKNGGIYALGDQGAE